MIVFAQQSQSWLQMLTPSSTSKTPRRMMSSKAETPSTTPMPLVGSEPVPVVKDEVAVEQPNDRRNPDSDAALEQDEKEAIDKSNILKGDRTRHAKPTSTYKEPGDEQGLPKSVLNGTDGHSSTR
ncbi:hypothetical protein WAI453_006429 [Rhynchosporium graminicola]